LLIRFLADTSTNNCLIILLWKDQSTFELARLNFGEQFIAKVKEMGRIINIFQGNAEVDKAKDIDFSSFNEF
jgi:hypothetical protein